jgi:hypothetical protein
MCTNAFRYSTWSRESRRLQEPCAPSFTAMLTCAGMLEISPTGKLVTGWVGRWQRVVLDLFASDELCLRRTETRAAETETKTS